ncbi:oxygenase MpaB family protein [Nocardia suismassiliense]|uniref:oxygenase MpaB family protein n=1 Tax=Nocardia suismassiliense TaxID=2077092 RepID=UPI00131F063C|nr:oxygenase MpaB family protein [Nocardia suismassiliense]
MDRLVGLQGEQGRKALELANAPRHDDGFFGPGSVSWRVYANPVVLAIAGIAGSVAVMLDPIGAAGVGQNSTYMSDIYGRVRRSNSVFTALIYGDTATALKAGRDLFRRHSHVNGVVPTTGEPYRANLPDALLFTYLAGFPCLVESFRKYSGETFTEDDEREFWGEHHVLGELLGIPRQVIPTTPEDVYAWLDDAERHKMAYTEPAQELVEFFMNPPAAPAIMGLVGTTRINKIVGTAVFSTLRPGTRAVCGIPDQPRRFAAADAIVRRSAAIARTKPLDRTIVPFFGYEAWGYKANALRHSPGTGRLPLDPDWATDLQHGKGGTLGPNANWADKAATK